jgi:hypothetical protein
MASAANLISRNVLLFATSTKTAAAAVNKQYLLQSSGISNFHLRHLETCNIFKKYCPVIFALTCIVRGVNNVLICPIPVFTSLTTKLDRAIPMFASAETRSQLLTATPYNAPYLEETLAQSSRKTSWEEPTKTRTQSNGGERK